MATWPTAIQQRGSVEWLRGPLQYNREGQLSGYMAHCNTTERVRCSNSQAMYNVHAPHPLMYVSQMYWSHVPRPSRHTPKCTGPQTFYTAVSPDLNKLTCPRPPFRGCECRSVEDKLLCGRVICGHSLQPTQVGTCTQSKASPFV